MKKIITVIFLFGTTLSLVAQTQYNWNEKTQHIYESITSLRIPEARKFNTIEKKNNPSNLILPLLDSYADFYQLFFNENTAEYNSIYPHFDQRIEAFKAGPHNSPFYLYSLAISHLHKALIAIRFEKNWEAAVDFRKAYLLFKQNKESYPNFSPNDVYYGLLTTIIGSVPSNYQWMLNLLGMNGSISKGNALVLSYINSKDEYATICRNEALFVYPYLVMNFEGNRKKTLDFIETTNYDFKKNHLHAYMATNLYLTNQQSEKSLDIANNIENNDAYLNLSFWHYEKGFAYLNQLKFDKAQKEFVEFTTRFKGKFYIKDCYEKMSWIAYLQNDLTKANDLRNQVLKKGSQTTDADKLAYQDAKSGIWPNPLLLKARLLSDGGLQQQALRVLVGKTTNDFNSEEDKTEFSYRLARIYELAGDKDQSIKYYKSTIEKGHHLKEYFAARAALQIGLIYEEKKEYKNAISYYTTCLDMRNHAFKNSIDQKAKAGLQRCQR